MSNVWKLLNNVEQLGVKDVKLGSLNADGISLGRLAHIWGIGYLSGGKARNTAS